MGVRSNEIRRRAEASAGHPEAREQSGSKFTGAKTRRSTKDRRSFLRAPSVRTSSQITVLPARRCCPTAHCCPRVHWIPIARCYPKARWIPTTHCYPKVRCCPTRQSYPQENCCRCSTCSNSRLCRSGTETYPIPSYTTTWMKCSRRTTDRDAGTPGSWIR